MLPFLNLYFVRKIENLIQLSSPSLQNSKLLRKELQTNMKIVLFVLAYLTLHKCILAVKYEPTSMILSTNNSHNSNNILEVRNLLLARNL